MEGPTAKKPFPQPSAAADDFAQGEYPRRWYLSSEGSHPRGDVQQLERDESCVLGRGEEENGPVSA